MSKRARGLLFFLLRILAAAAVLFLLQAFVVTPRIIHGNSMYPALQDGQLVLVFRLGKPAAGSIVLYRSPEGEERNGRVIAAARDVVEIEEAAGILVNGSFLERRIPWPVPEGELIYPYPVKENAFFLMNDYREDAEDSRSFGAVSEEEILGTVIFALQYRDF